MQDLVKRALNGDRITSTEIQAFGGYEKFDAAVKEAQKPAKPPKQSTRGENTWGSPDYNYRKDVNNARGQANLWIGKMLFFLLFAPAGIVLLVNSCHG